MNRLPHDTVGGFYTTGIEIGAALCLVGIVLRSGLVTLTGLTVVIGAVAGLAVLLLFRNIE